MNTLAPSFLIGSSSFLPVLRTYIKAWMSSNFGKFTTKLWSLIDVRFLFLLNILKTNIPIKTKFCLYIIVDKIYVVIVIHCCCFLQKFATELRPLIVVRIWFLLNILRKNKQNETKFCIHIIIGQDVAIVNPCFSHIFQQSYCP